MGRCSTISVGRAKDEEPDERLLEALADLAAPEMEEEVAKLPEVMALAMVLADWSRSLLEAEEWEEDEVAEAGLG